ncbi:hypothetical protein DFH27DRAFT_584266 [Peziza echinospora]|nr:hypothetical protein DFH27DRAFT_584266 [Peziza echinospora]
MYILIPSDYVHRAQQRYILEHGSSLNSSYTCFNLVFTAILDFQAIIITSLPISVHRCTCTITWTLMVLLLWAT